MTCRICHKDAKTRHIDLYVFGSEGLRVCHKCEMEIVTHVRKMAHAAIRERMDEVLDRRKEDEQDG